MNTEPIQKLILETILGLDSKLLVIDITVKYKIYPNQEVEWIVHVNHKNTEIIHTPQSMERIENDLSEKLGLPIYIRLVKI